MIQLMLGDCLHELTKLPDNYVDSIVTDPPYGLSFMGKSWDYDVPATNIWAECLRVLKPGGHLLSFFGTRTYHRGVVKIEDAGFEIRDQIMWIYGSGFPKSTDVSKRIDKEAKVEREIIGSKDVGPDMRGGNFENAEGRMVADITAPATDAAKQWQGWGTALKPANEPIVVARKPLEKGLTVAQNVLKWGTGALNIDGSRIDLNGKVKTSGGCKGNTSPVAYDLRENPQADNSQGRWPANVIFDEEAAKVLDEQSGISKSTGGGALGFFNNSGKNTSMGDGSKDFYTPKKNMGKEDVGGASRFFYCAKASKSERNAGLEGMPLVRGGTERMNNSDGRKAELGESDRQTLNQNFHPTVKPIKLMTYLINLVTPPGGIVLDCFLGSGTTGVAAKLGGFSFIGIEREEQYMEIARRRIESAKCEEVNVVVDPQLEFPA